MENIISGKDTFKFDIGEDFEGFGRMLEEAFT
jgi:hypothetical protein